MRGLSATTSSGQPDLTNLFRLAAHEAKKSHMQGRILRVVSGGCLNDLSVSFHICWLALGISLLSCAWLEVQNLLVTYMTFVLTALV